VQIAFFGVAVLLFALVPLRGVINSIVLAARGRTVVTSSTEGIVLAEQGAWRVKTTRIPAADVLGLDYGTADAALQSARQIAERRAHAGRMPLSSSRNGAAPRWLAVLRRLVKSKGVIIKCRSGLIAFGAGLPDEEVRYLHAIVGRTLGGPDGHRW